MRKKTEYQRKQEAKAKAARELESIKTRLKLTNPGGPLKGVQPSPLVATTQQRTPELVPTSDRIPGSAPAKDLLHAHKWKRGAEETTTTAKEMRKKAAQIAPAYNKGPLQYLPAGTDTDEWPSRQEQSKRRT